MTATEWRLDLTGTKRIPFDMQTDAILKATDAIAAYWRQPIAQLLASNFVITPPRENERPPRFSTPKRKQRR